MEFAVGFALGGLLFFCVGIRSRRTADARLIDAMAERCYGQSQLLTKRAERERVAGTGTGVSDA